MDIREKIKQFPQKPGVYKFLAKDGEVLYIGKAKNLKARVAQYFSGHDTREQIPFLLSEAADVDYTVVNNELESLYLENTQIKQYLPRFNIMLRDDKNYAFITIDYSTEIPQIGIARKIENNIDRHAEDRVHPRDEESKKLRQDSSSAVLLGMTPRARYFGPFSAAYKIRNTLNLVRRIFPYCSAQKVSSRPCFYYYLHRCPGVCVGKMSLEDYAKHLDTICNFLSGNSRKIQKQIGAEMKLASSQKLYEKAARLRDQLQALELLEEKQSVILTKKVNWDIISCHSDFGYACINLFKVRAGKLADKENFVMQHPNLQMKHGSTNVYKSTNEYGKEKDGTTEDYGKGDKNIVQTFLEQYYLEATDIPEQVYIPEETVNQTLIEQLLKERTGKKVTVAIAKKGKTKGLLNLGKQNAEEYLRHWLDSKAGHLDAVNSALTQLQEVLNLPELPQRIECYDISNIQGTNAVGSMVVFEQGLPKKSEYRKFKIRTKSTPDDFTMMKEMLSRRLNRIKNQESGIKNENTWPLPNLIVIDGGKGQLNAALAALEMSNSKFLISKQTPNSHIQIPTIGLAKRIEEIFLPGKSEPIILGHDQPGLKLLQRLRDEAHRFGITYHRALRSKQAVKSALDDIPGIGPKTKKLLKQKFGTVANIRKASLNDLAEVVGEHLARLIQQTL